MKKNKNSNNKYILLTFPLLLMVLLICWFILKDSPDNKEAISTTPDTVNYSPPTKQEIDEAEEDKLENNDKDTTTIDNNVVTQNEAKIIDLYYDADISQVVVKTQLSGLGWDSCTLELTSGSLVVTKEVKTLYQQDYSTCLGYSIDKSEFGTAKTWSVKLSAKKQDGGQYIANSSVTIE